MSCLCHLPPAVENMKCLGFGAQTDPGLAGGDERAARDAMLRPATCYLDSQPGLLNVL